MIDPCPGGPHHAHAYGVGGGKKFNDYQFTDMGPQLTLGTFCHENGHMICDYPDLRDYGYESHGAGNYSLMAFGGSDNRNPVHVDAYLKNEAGWATSVRPVGSGTHSINAGDNDFYVHPLSATEYFIIENRQQTGRDAAIPDAGLAIWHIDENGSNSNEQMTAGQHYECSIEQADGRFDLEHNANYGDGQDLYGAPGVTRFASDTVPSSNWWSGASSALTIENISAPGPTMTFTGGQLELVVPTSGMSPGAGGSTGTPGSSPTPPETVAPTSSGPATPASGSPEPRPTTRSASDRCSPSSMRNVIRGGCYRSHLV